MRFACNLIGVTLRDTMRSEDTGEELKMNWIDEDIKEYQKKWMQHLERINYNTVFKITMSYKPVGLMELGRPRNC
jgi:hypothetical protein